MATSFSEGQSHQINDMEEEWDGVPDFLKAQINRNGSIQTPAKPFDTPSFQPQPYGNGAVQPPQYQVHLQQHHGQPQQQQQLPIYAQLPPQPQQQLPSQQPLLPQQPGSNGANVNPYYNVPNHGQSSSLEGIMPTPPITREPSQQTEKPSQQTRKPSQQYKVQKPRGNRTDTTPKKEDADEVIKRKKNTDAARDSRARAKQLLVNTEATKNGLQYEVTRLQQENTWLWTENRRLKDQLARYESPPMPQPAPSYNFQAGNMQIQSVNTHPNNYYPPGTSFAGPVMSNSNGAITNAVANHIMDIFAQEGANQGFPLPDSQEFHTLPTDIQASVNDVWTGLTQTAGDEGIDLTNDAVVTTDAAAAATGEFTAANEQGGYVSNSAESNGNQHATYDPNMAVDPQLTIAAGPSSNQDTVMAMDISTPANQQNGSLKNSVNVDITTNFNFDINQPVDEQGGQDTGNDSLFNDVPNIDFDFSINEQNGQFETDPVIANSSEWPPTATDGDLPMVNGGADIDPSLLSYPTTMNGFVGNEEVRAWYQQLPGRHQAEFNEILA